MRATDQWAMTCSRPVRPMVAARSRSREEFEHPAGHGRIIAGGDQIAGLAVQNGFAHGAHAGGDHRLLAGHGLQQTQRIGLAVRGQHQHVQQRQHFGHVVARAQEADDPGDPEASWASASSLARSGPSPTTRNRAAGSASCTSRRDAEEHLVVLLRPQRRHDAHHRRRRRPSRALAAAPGWASADETAPRRRRWGSRGPSRAGQPSCSAR